jgi:hypothetical protein
VGDAGHHPREAAGLEAQPPPGDGALAGALADQVDEVLGDGRRCTTQSGCTRLCRPCTNSRRVRSSSSDARKRWSDEGRARGSAGVGFGTSTHRFDAIITSQRPWPKRRRAR